ncbi:tetratricopeptide repeat protein [Persicimonas caeni]|nr:tetratricopeptide repeat protein [Persicimonas caeni]
MTSFKEHQMIAFFNRSSDNTKARLLAAALLAALCLALPAQGWAQEGAPEEKEKEEKTVQVAEAKDQKERPSLEGEEEGPNVSASSSIPTKQVENVRRLDEQIVQLKKLIDSCPQSNPKCAEYLFNLSEMYWDKSKYYEMTAFKKQDQCYTLDDKGNKQKAKQCRASMQRMLDEAERLKKEAVQLYVDIYQNHPNFKDLDKVLFYLGTNLQEIGKQEEAIKIFKRLIRDFPNTKYVPNVLLSFGEYYFNNDDAQNALKAYKKAAQYKDSEVYAYAKYKAGWCYFNMAQKDKALDTFINVIKYAKKHPNHPQSKALIKQARKDIVRTYSHVGNPKKAIPFLKDITNDDKETWLKLAERLAIHYGDMGNTRDSTRMYRQLIKLNKTSVKTIDYQYEIVRNQTVSNAYSVKSIKELVRLMKLVQYADQDKFGDTKEQNYDRKRKRVESLVRQWATQYHREAQKTKNADLYSMAYHLYKHYLETFPDSPKKYTTTFFYAELLYKLQQWEKAAESYEKVIDIDPKGKYTEDAVHAAVLAYFKVVDTSEEQAEIAESSIAKVDDETSDEKDEKKDGEQAKKEPPKPKEIPDLHKKFIHALERYMKHAPDGERIVDVKYNLARTYYDFNHFREALEIFKDIAYNHSEHRLAVIAANLHLDTLNLLNDFEGLHKAVVGYIEKEPIDDGPFMDSVNTLNVQIRFKICTVHDEKEQWKDAAKCFVQFYRDFPQSEYVDKALYNAALDFERMRDLGKAIKVRVFLLKATPQSPLAPKTLYNIGGNYHALAVYSQAAKFYELFVANFPEHEKAEPALANASEFRYGLGDYDRAIKDYEHYLKLFGKKKPERAAIAYFQIARIYEKQGEERKALKQYQRFLREYEKKSDYDRILKAHAAIGMYYWDEGGPRNKRRALKEFKKTLDIYTSLDEKTQGELSDGRDAAARAKFMIGEDVFQEMAEITIKSANEKELQKRIKKKMEVAEKAQKIFEQVILFKRPDWAIAALYRIGAQYQNFAETVRNSPVPKRLTYDQEEIYKGLLEDRASMIENKAVQAYKQALDVALKQNWFNEYSKKAEIQLAKLRPREYRKPSELRAEPEHLNPGFMRSAFITKMKEEDRLQDFDQGTTEDAAEDAVESSDVEGEGAAEGDETADAS